MSRNLPPRHARRAYGAVGITLLVVLVAASIASYRGAFTPKVTVTLEADRAGLIMQPGSAVMVHGVPVGTVAAVEPTKDGGAELTLEIDPAEAEMIPAETTATIEASTVFGPKTVALAVPSDRPSQHLRDGSVIRTAGVATEINDVFADLQSVLISVDVGKLNATLGNVAYALDGRGRALGDYAADLDHYLAQVNDSLPTIRADITAAADVSNAYADAAPDLLQVLRGTTTTARTLVELQGTIDEVLVGLTRSAERGQRFLSQAGPPLVTALDALRPVVRLLAEYSPELTCTVKGLNRARTIIGKALGNQMPALVASASVLPGQQAYQPGRDLPRVVTGLGPDCYQLPYVRADQLPLPRYMFADGASNVYAGPDDSLTPVLPGVTLYESLFGSGE